jgi:hypothetical protein
MKSNKLGIKTEPVANLLVPLVFALKESCSLLVDTSVGQFLPWFQFFFKKLE